MIKSSPKIFQKVAELVKGLQQNTGDYVVRTLLCVGGEGEARVGEDNRASTA